jgi:hypothetical protein
MLIYTQEILQHGLLCYYEIHGLLSICMLLLCLNSTRIPRNLTQTNLETLTKLVISQLFFIHSIVYSILLIKIQLDSVLAKAQ